jgi:NAD(P)-dependent dehydrogenase (short-subunit alcohol dehydrogenase family)
MADRCGGSMALIRADQHVQRAKRTNVALEEYYKAHGKEIPLGRAGEAEEFANLACLLASEQGSYITGTAINVDGVPPWCDDPRA